MYEKLVTSLALSKRLAEIVKCESEHHWANADTCGGTAGYIEHHNKFFIYPENEIPRDDLLKKYGGQRFPAYTLGELPEVLKALGEKDALVRRCEGCGYKIGKNRRSCFTRHCSGGIADPFIEICRLYATDPKAAWDYLENLIK